MASPPPGPPEPDRLIEWGRTLLWLNLLATAVVFSTRTTEAFELPKTLVVRGVALALAVGMVAVWGVAADRRRAMVSGLRELASDWVSLGVALSWAAAAVSAVTSISPRTSFWGAQGSFAGLVALSAYAVLFFATRSFCRTADAARGVLSGAVLGLGFSVAYGAVQVAGLDPLRWEAPIVFAGVRRVFSTQGHPNSFAQLLVVCGPLVFVFLARATRARRYGEAILLGLLGAGVVSLIGLTLSRAGALALLAGVVVAIGGGWRAGVPPRRVVLFGAGFFVLAAFALAAAIATDPGEGYRALLGRLAHGTAGGAARAELRRFLWAGAWAAFRDHPIVGVGVDCLSLVFGRYRTPAAWSAEWGETPLKAHCQLLEILATRGLLGGAAGLVLLLGLWRAGVRAVRAESRDPELAVAALAGLAAFLVHNTFHFPTAAGTSLALTLAAVLSVLAQEPEADPAPARPTAGQSVVGIAFAGALLYGLVLVPLRADVLGQAGTVVVRADPPRAVALEREAVRLDPTRDLLWLRLAAALQAEGLDEVEPAKRRAFLEEARRAAEQGVALVPVNAYNQAHLGTLLADLERESPPLANRAEAEQAFETARALDPSNPDIEMAAAGAALAAGDLDRARSWAVGTAALYPGFGPPPALLGAVALVEGRQLAARGEAVQAQAKWNEAARLLREGLLGDWHGDEGSRSAAERNLASALANSSAPHKD
jgi:O-antigen ligase